MSLRRLSSLRTNHRPSYQTTVSSAVFGGISGMEDNDKCMSIMILGNAESCFIYDEIETLLDALSVPDFLTDFCFQPKIFNSAFKISLTITSSWHTEIVVN